MACYNCLFCFEAFSSEITTTIELSLVASHWWPLYWGDSPLYFQTDAYQLRTRAGATTGYVHFSI